ncbi:MAG: metal-dependent transcriptional regulator, partial [Thermodesulfobacteriota bacterium]|nr:metal-dependent transcriptional regulator [Thermodesulfobacteriota bacterium]
MLTEKQEEILEAIWAAGENERHTLDAIKKRCVVEIFDEDLAGLEAENLVVRDGDRVLLTATGSPVAEGVIRRHRLAEVMVSVLLRLKDDSMKEMACKIEHALLPEVEESICTLLGHPEICPDGKPIPRGKCCSREQRVVDNVVVSLSELQPSESGRITYIKPGSHSGLHQLIALGLNPGVQVTVHRTSPAFIIKFENTELAMDEEVARDIYVWKTKDSAD